MLVFHDHYIIIPDLSGVSFLIKFYMGKNPRVSLMFTRLELCYSLTLYFYDVVFLYCILQALNKKKELYR